jgi:tetratricopeptide (TPR) repeat protein
MRLGIEAARLTCALVLLVVALIGNPARAATQEEVDAATSLLAQGRIDEAEALVRRLRAEPDPQLQVIFLSGMILVERGEYMDAADEFRRMLQEDPSLLRPRLELGRTLYLAGEYQAARYHFEQVLSVPLPEAVRNNVLRYVNAIREREPSLIISLDVVFDSNPRQATSSETVEIGGKLYTLNADAREQSGRGLGVKASGKLPFGPDRAWFVRGYLESYDYSGREFDFAYLQALGGRHFNLGPHSLDLEAGAHYAAYQGTDLYRGPNLVVTDFVRLRQNLTLTASVDARELVYDQYSFLDGWQYVESVELRYALSPRQSLRGGGLLVQSNAEEDAFAFDGYAVNARYIREWRGGWISSIFGQFAAYRYRAIDPFFDNQRDDHEWRVELMLTNRKLMYRGLAPTFTLGYVERDSNIELYAFERTYVRVGVTKEF